MQVLISGVTPVAVVYRIKQKYRHCLEAAIKIIERNSIDAYYGIKSSRYQ